MQTLEERVATLIDQTEVEATSYENRTAIARTIIPLVLEEAARVAEHIEVPEGGLGSDKISGWLTAIREIAASIRALGGGDE